MFFEKDLKQRFNLAIASGNIQVAFDAAKELKEKDNFLKLAQTALLLGSYDITEKCYQMARALDKVNFFYMSTGSFGKLKKMQGVAQAIGDTTLRFNTALLTGDVKERINILAETGQIPLAYLMAKSHGLQEIEKTLADSLRETEGLDFDQIEQQAEQFSRKGKSLLPLRPLFVQNESFQQSEWPMTNRRAKEAEEAEQMFLRKKYNEAHSTNMDNDTFFDAKDFHSSNSNVDTILKSIPQGGAGGQNSQQDNQQMKKAPVAANLDNIEGGNWGDEEEIEIDDEIPGVGDQSSTQQIQSSGKNSEH